MFDNKIPSERVFYSPTNEGGKWPNTSLNMGNITPEFFNRTAEEVARDLLGRKLVSTIDGVETAGYIVETQAYTGVNDLESHAYRGESSRKTNWKPGSLYIYSVQGQAMLTFAVPPFDGATVLVRALEPVCGLETMEERLGGTGKRLVLTQGPGRLTKSLGITSEYNGTNVFEDSVIKVEPGIPLAEDSIRNTPRVNCSKNPLPLLRFYMAENRWVTNPK